MKPIRKAAAKKKTRLTGKIRRRKAPSKSLAQQIRELSLSNEQLLKLAEESPPPPEFFQGEVERPW